MPYRKTAFLSLLLTAITLLSACKSLPEKEIKKVPFSALYPEFIQISAPKPTRGVEISARFLADPMPTYAKHYQFIRGSLVQIEGAVPMSETVRPALRLKPGGDKAILEVRIRNDSSHVIRSGNALFTIRYDDGLDLHRRNFKGGLKDLMLAPGDSKTYKFGSLTLKDLAISNRSGKIKVGIYELKIGDALENFEWEFEYVTHKKEYMAFPEKSSSRHYFRDEAVPLLRKKVIYDDNY